MTKLIILLLIFLPGKALAEILNNDGSPDEGKKAYDYFCYQCHAYAGTGRTLAANFLEPPPRDFSRADPEVLTRERMITAVTEGRASTGMKSFSRVLVAQEREAVVDYIRREFMSGEQAAGRYHTLENGWPEHRQKYSLAYPFAAGELATDTPRDRLNEEQTIGLELFRTSCVSCHDQGKLENSDVIWRARSSSFPRRHYDHRIDPWDTETSATPFQRHDLPPDAGNESLPVRLGQKVFLENCAFCHGADGTGKNWIGSFMEPPAADLTGPRLASFSKEALRNTILNGVPGGTMPAWRGLLESDQLAQLLAYLDAMVLGSGISPGAETGPEPSRLETVVTKPGWSRD